MSKRASVVLFGILASGGFAQGVAACSSTKATPSGDDGGADARSDVVVPVADTAAPGPPQCSGTMPVMTAFDPATGGDIAPDWSCYLSGDAGFLLLGDAGDAADDADASSDDGGDAMAIDDGSLDAAPDAPAPVDAGSTQSTFHLTDFILHTKVVGAGVDFFYSTSAAGTPGFSGTTDNDGQISFVAPQGGSRVLAYRVNAMAGATAAAALPTLIQYDLMVQKAPVLTEGLAVTQGEVSLLLAGILGSQPPVSGLASLVVPVRDCQTREVRGATIMFLDGVTGQPVATGKGSGQMRTDYFLGGFPNPGCSFTNDDQAVWGAVNAPTNMPGSTHKYTLRLLGRMHATDVQPVVMGERDIELWPDTITIARPYRLTPPP